MRLFSLLILLIFSSSVFSGTIERKRVFYYVNGSNIVYFSTPEEVCLYVTSIDPTGPFVFEPWAGYENGAVSSRVGVCRGKNWARDVGAKYEECPPGYEWKVGTPGNICTSDDRCPYGEISNASVFIGWAPNVKYDPGTPWPNLLCDGQCVVKATDYVTSWADDKNGYPAPAYSSFRGILTGATCSYAQKESQNNPGAQPDDMPIPKDGRCASGYVKVSVYGGTSCHKGTCPAGTVMGEYNGEPMCIDGEGVPDPNDPGSGSGSGNGEDDGSGGGNDGDGDGSGGDGSGSGSGGDGQGGSDGSGGDGDSDSDKSGLEKLLDDFLKHKGHVVGEKGEFEDLSKDISSLKQDLQDKIQSITSEASDLLGSLPEGGGSLPCSSVNAFGRTVSLCLSKYAAQLSIVGAVIVFAACVSGAAIIFRG